MKTKKYRPPSKFQLSFEKLLRPITNKLGYTILVEHIDKDLPILNLGYKRKHYPDFYIKELNLFIETSGQNYLHKLLKLRRAHKLPDIHYVSLIDIENPELGLPKVSDQINEFLAQLEAKMPPEEMAKLSYLRLENLIKTFNNLFYDSE